MAFKFTFIIFFLIFPFFSSPLLSQSEDGFLDDFGGESFSELEAEIDFETAEIFVDKDVSLDLEISKDPSGLLTELGVSAVQSGSNKGYRIGSEASQQALAQAGFSSPTLPPSS